MAAAGGGTPWGAIIEGIFGTINKGQDYELQEVQVAHAQLMRPGKYQPQVSSSNRDTIVFVVMIVLLVVVVWLFKK